jgi:glycerophosphoryl diester phosphodiesterase
MNEKPHKKLLIIAHRGVSSLEIENTMSAFRRAVEIGADMIEFDVQQTKDKKLVICHDFNLKRLGGIDVDIDKISLNELKKIKIKNKKISEEKTELIPTLEEFLKEFVGKINASTAPSIDPEPAKRINFNLEIKSIFGHVFTEIDQLLNLLDFYKAQNRVLISSFDFDLLKKIRDLRKDLRLAMLVGQDEIFFWNRFFKEERLIKKALSIGAENIHVPMKNINKKFVDLAHKFGLKILPFVAYPGKDFQKCLECGVDGIFTNHPQEFIRKN